jgi:hypothetical protein
MPLAMSQVSGEAVIRALYPERHMMGQIPPINPANKR